MSIKLLRVHMRSGKTFDIAPDPNEQDAIAAATELHDALDFTTTNSLRLGPFVFRFVEIEAFEYIETG